MFGNMYKTLSFFVGKKEILILRWKYNSCNVIYYGLFKYVLYDIIFFVNGCNAINCIIRKKPLDMQLSEIIMIWITMSFNNK